MSTLADLQRRFQAHVLHAAPALTEAVGSAEADAATRLQVYSGAYRSRLVEVLGNDFPGLRTLVGDEAFDSLCRAYIETHPSHHFNLRWYGGALAAFLESAAPWSTRPELGEMARLEWDLTLVFDAGDEPVVTAADVAALPAECWPAMKPRLHGAIRRRSCHWNTAAIRSAVDRGASVPPLQQLGTVEHRIVWRMRRDVRHRALEVDEAAALDAVTHGTTFEDLCELLTRWHATDDVAMRLVLLLKRWIGDEWLTALQVD
jgi:hypothetical protein